MGKVITGYENGLREKVGTAAVDYQTLVADAEVALEALSAQYSIWLADELHRLDGAHNQFLLRGCRTADAVQLHFRFHDLRGLGTTFGYPLITRVSASAAELLTSVAQWDGVGVALLSAHVDAIFALVRQECRSDDTAMATELVRELELQVAQKLR